MHYNRTALGIAINQGGSEEIIDYLLAQGANPRLVFDDLKEARNIPGLQLLSKKSSDITSDEVYQAVKQIGVLRFLEAVQDQELVMIKGFVEKKLVDINAKSPINGKTALDIAVNQENNKEIIDYLLANGAKDDTIEPLGIVFENLEE